MTAADRFRELHVPGRPLLMPNPWDAGTARLLASIGFQALATTSSGHAATLGRLDGAVTREQALAHARELAAAVDVPVSADLEDGFGLSPEDVAATVRDAAAAGLAGCSIEDWGRDGIIERGLAAERIRAGAEAARSVGIVLTARAENLIRGNPDLDDTVERLQAYAEAGADVLYAPGLKKLDDIRRVCSSVDRPVNVLARRGMADVGQLADAGVARVSVGGAFAFAALAAVAAAGRELLEAGTYGFFTATAEGSRLAGNAFEPPADPD